MIASFHNSVVQKLIKIGNFRNSPKSSLTIQ